MAGPIPPLQDFMRMTYMGYDAVKGHYDGGYLYMNPQMTQCVIEYHGQYYAASTDGATFDRVYKALTAYLHS